MNRRQRPITDRELRAWLAAGEVDRGVGEGLAFVASPAAPFGSTNSMYGLSRADIHALASKGSD